MNDDFDVKMSILRCFLVILKDAIARSDWVYLNMFLDSKLSSIAIDMWIETSPDTHREFTTMLEEAKESI